MKWLGHIPYMGENRKAYKILVGKPEGKRPHGRSRHRWEDNIKMDLRKTVGKMWTECIWWAPGNTVMNLRVP
jgi:hypothetical protein